jgi:hypothetical protein
MTKSADTASDIFNFRFQGQNDTYQVAFNLDNGRVTSSCSCRYKSSKKLCWHRNYILSGKHKRINSEAVPLQTKLIDVLSRSLAGRELLALSSSLPHHETCRRCNKDRVIDMKESFWGRFIKHFLPAGRKYYCLSCRWSW